MYDHAYYWPHFTPIPAAVEYGSQDVAVFTLSKLTGHAGRPRGLHINPLGRLLAPGPLAFHQIVLSQSSGRMCHILRQFTPSSHELSSC